MSWPQYQKDLAASAGDYWRRKQMNDHCDVTPAEAREVAYAAAVAGKGWLAVKLWVWVLLHAGRATHGELRTRVNAIRVELGRAPL